VPPRFGDWLRYGSFVAISGGNHWAAFFPLAWTMFFNLTALKERDAKHQRGGTGADKYVAATPAVVPWRLLF
jgi:hypothetical protein